MRLFLNICSCICYVVSFYFVFILDNNQPSVFFDGIDKNFAAVVMALWGVGFILQAHSFPHRVFDPEKWFEGKDQE
ncbi:MAG: hypothetical protein VW127_09200 [Flavobacteriaceae bacterium]|jgi:hypothetical protein